MEATSWTVSTHPRYSPDGDRTGVMLGSGMAGATTTDANGEPLSADQLAVERAVAAVARAQVQLEREIASCCRKIARRVVREAQDAGVPPVERVDDKLRLLFRPALCDGCGEGVTGL